MKLSVVHIPAPFKRFHRTALQALAREDGASALVIASVIAAVAFTAVSGFLATRSNTELRNAQSGRTNLSTVYDALVVAAIRDQPGAENEDHHLPCPADPTAASNFGEEGSRTGDACDQPRGIVPFRTIGLSEDQARDGYGTYITYVVDDTDTSLCVGDQPNAGTIEDLTDNTTDHLFALISHGANRAGGYSAQSNQIATEPSVAEIANCASNGGACSAVTANQVRSGPYSETEGDDYFDDDVKLAVAADFTRDCEILEDEDINVPEGAQMSLDTRERAVLYAEGANSNGTDNTDGQASVEAFSPNEDYTDANGEIYYRIRFDNVNSVATASCFFNDSAFQLRDSTVRTYMEFAARSELNDTPATPNGNGSILAFMSYDPSTYRIAATTCGGADQYMGFADQPGYANRQLPDVPRVGVEIDTYSHNGMNGNLDPANNHVAIINRNNSHAGTVDDGPTCTNGDTSSGCIAEAPANIELPDVSSDPNNWVEVGTVASNDIAPEYFHRLRVELHQYTGACPTADEVRVDVWVYANVGGTNRSFPSCPEGEDTEGSAFDCRNLENDYADVEAPHLSYCLPWSGDSADDYIRFGFTSGARAVANSNGEDWFTIQSFGLRSDRHNPAAAPLAADNARSVEITNVDLASTFASTYSLTTLNATVDSALAMIDVADDGDYFGAKLVAKYGTFTLNYASTSASTPEELYDAEGFGVVGIGNADNNALDDYWDGTTYPRSSGEKEGVEVTFPYSVSRVTLALGDFEDEGNGAERVRVTAYSADTEIDDTIVSACNTANDQAMVVSLDYSGDPIDRILIEPQTATSLPGGTVTNTYGTGVWLQGIKACGINGSCGLTVEHDCYQYNGDFPYGGRGAPSVTETGMITGDHIATALNTGAPSPIIRLDDAGETPWVSLDFEITGAGTDNGPVAVDIFGQGSITNDVHIEDNGNDVQEGFAVDDALLETADSESIDFRFANTWRQVVMSLGRFGRTNTNAGNQERATIRGYRDGVQVGQDYVFTACNVTNNTGTTGTGNLALTWPSDIDQVTVTPTVTSLSAAVSFVIRGIRACSNGASCAVTGTYATTDCTTTDTVSP